jgi:subtilisin-like proprotein convertase family protein
MCTLAARWTTRIAVFITVCALGFPALAQEQKKSAAPPSAEPETAAAPDALVEATHAANVEAAQYQPAATLTSSAPIVIPATGTSGPSNPYPAQINVSGLPTSIGRLEVRLNALTHTFPADLDILLVGPGGQNVMLMSDVGASFPIEGTFLTFSDGSPALSAASQLVSGTFAPTNNGAGDVLPAPAPVGPYGTSLASFIGTNPNGLWSLYVYDQDLLDVGRLYGFSLIITPQFNNTTPLPIPDFPAAAVESSIAVTGLTNPITKVAVSLHLTHTFDGDLEVSLVGPDGTVVPLSLRRGGAGANFGSSCATANRTTFDDLAPTAITAGVAPFIGAFRPEQPLSAFNGRAPSGTWRLRVRDAAGVDVGTLQCWSVAIRTAEPVQPPTALTVANAVGNSLTFKWTASPAGPPPTSFVFEGGITPGQVLATVPTAAESLTLSVPNGSFFVRVKAVSGADTSSQSNELPIYVNVAVPPSAPANLLITRNGSNLDLTWRNTFAGAAPTGLFLDVGGAVAASLPLPVTESFSYSGVPAGAYTFSVRASNGAGVSGPSNTRSATFPGACSGAPQTPANFRAFRIGSTLFVDWDSPAVGSAVSYYVLSVTGAFALTVPTPLQALSGAVPAGTYNLSVVAVNPCGNSPSTAVKSVTVP